jgi:condensin complex subunit 3
MEDTMPVVAEQAFRIQEEYNKLEEVFQAEDEDDVAERSFIIGELMRLAVHMDYTDQYGRTAMFKHASKSPLHVVQNCFVLIVLGEMISQPDLPESLIPKCMDILVKIANSERDLIRVIVDVVSELREGQGDEEMDAVSILSSLHHERIADVSRPQATFQLPVAPFDAGRWLLVR